MNTLDIKPGERVKDVHFTEDNLSVDLIDGCTITVPLAWYPGCFTLQRNNVKTGNYAAVDTASTGRTLMRILAPKACCVAPPHPGERCHTWRN